MISRRFFLRAGTIALASFGLDPLFLDRAAYAFPHRRLVARGKTLVCLFQRGAVDGLNMVVPFGERAYYRDRPRIAVPSREIVNLDGHFGLHPELAALKPLWDNRSLAIVHAVGSPDDTRSHFDAQDYMESGTPGVKSTTDGWLNRYCQHSHGLQAQRPETRDKLTRAFESLYQGSATGLLASTSEESFEAVQMIKEVNPTQYRPAAGVQYPRGRFGQSLMQIAQLIKADMGLEVAFTDIDGWDTHVNQGAGDGQLANRFREFGQGMAAFSTDLGERMADVVVLTMSEFGRTARENGNRGTDHGRATAMMVMGGSVSGGKVYGRWPGLEAPDLYQGRDLAVTTDFRDLFGEVVAGHLGASNLGPIFPGYQLDQGRFPGVMG
jgi:uncharacterized protein (DUF1501 family)